MVERARPHDAAPHDDDLGGSGNGHRARIDAALDGKRDPGPERIPA
jgi:hypothetical protein